MKILVISDTHGYIDRVAEALRRERPVDAVIHCGDIEGQEHMLEKIAGCPCYMVTGNNDWASHLKREITTSFDNVRVFITHGHRYGVSLGNERIREEADSRQVDLCLFGHTHRPVVETSGGLTLMNPGSLSYPRQAGRKPTYGIIETGGRQGLRCSIRQLD